MSELCKILCVDDEALILKTFRRFFLDEEIELLTASSADEGLKLLSLNAPVQIVLSDFRMPGENGLEFLRRVRKIWPDTVGLLVSGYADLTLVEQALEEREIFRFIPKPWDEEELRGAVSEALDIYRNRTHVDGVADAAGEAAAPQAHTKQHTPGRGRQ